MTDFRTASSIGERIQAARKARGLSARELAKAIGGIPSQSTIENIELGRKASIDVVQLLNIAMAVRVPLSYLLAPMGAPDAPLDLPGLSEEFDSMTSAELDAWLSSVPNGARIASSLDERNAVAELQALRELRARLSERDRLASVVDLELASTPPGNPALLRTAEARLEEVRREIERLVSFLQSAGWSVAPR